MDKINSVFQEFVLTARRVVTVVNILLKIVYNVLQVLLELDQFVKGDVSAINSMIMLNKNVFLAVLPVLLAHHSTTVPPVKILLSLLEEVSALIALILAILVIHQEPALPVLVDSTSSKVHAKPPVLLELYQSTEPVNVNQA